MSRIAGSMLGEFAEKGWREYLEKNPDKFRGILEQLSKRSEVGAKVLGISAGEFARSTISFLDRKYAGDSILIAALANTSDDVIRESVEAFVEFAKSGQWQHAAAPTKATAPSRETVVVRIKRPGLGTVVHRSVLISKHMTGLCLVVREEEDKWNASHQPVVIKDQAGGGGRGGRGDRQGKGGGPALKLADAEPFPLEVLTIADAKDTGFTECPKCQPFTYASAEEQKKEAAMAETTAATAAAKNANKPKPIEGWEDSVGPIGRWLAIAFSASLENTDLGNEMRTVSPKIWMDRALLFAKKYCPGVDFMSLSAVEVYELELPETLKTDEVEAVVRLIFTAGAGQTDANTKFQSVLDHLSGKKKAAEEEKKAADEKAKKDQALLNAQAKLAAASNPVEIELAKAEILKAEKALEPPPPPPKSRKALWISLGVAAAAIWVIVTIVTL